MSDDPLRKAQELPSNSDMTGVDGGGGGGGEGDLNESLPDQSLPQDGEQNQSLPQDGEQNQSLPQDGETSTPAKTGDDSIEPSPVGQALPGLIGGIISTATTGEPALGVVIGEGIAALGDHLVSVSPAKEGDTPAPTGGNDHPDAGVPGGIPKDRLDESE